MRHKIQDLIGYGEVVVGNHNKNLDHQAFKDPFPPHEKGESSNTKNAHTKVNYTYAINENIIHMVKPIDDEYYNVITIKGKEDTPKRKNPFVSKGPMLASSDTTPSKVCTNVVTWSHVKIVLKGPKLPTTAPKPTTKKTTIGSTSKMSKLVPLTTAANYNILDQLQ